MKRALILAAPLVLTLGLVACGDDDDDDAPDTTATADTETESTATDRTLLPGGTVLPGGTILPGGTVLPGGSLPTIPDLSMPDLSELSIPENAGELLQQIFPNLDDSQIDCLIDALGGDVDPSRVPSAIQECDIAP